ncbi:MAG: rhodanese-like domain-containing protein [Desulfobulbaceae bacterium]|nr:rhodanese-like domain-containing protein [Desulfobulbaceae bacterium]HIJ91350.1 rhodanese-like domain-containing protein [Deltaproteobacteria bacterium]
MRHRHSLTTAFLCTLLSLFSLFAAPVIAADIPTISTEELKKKLDAKETLVLADALSPIEHKEKAIQGSVNIPEGKVKGNPNLPADKKTLLIFYCLGPKCGKSKMAAKTAQGLGYTNIMVYDEGLPAWIQSGNPVTKTTSYPNIELARLTPQQLNDTLKSVTILDIRDAKHKESGRMAGAIEIEMDDLEEKYATIPKDKKVVVIDHAAKQVLVAAKYLSMNGYKNLAALDGGMMAWIAAGLPVNK